MNYSSGRELFGLILLLLAGLSLSVSAQTGSEAEVRKAVLASVQAFFDTMAAKDVGGAAETVVPNGRFYSIREVDGKRVVRTFTNQEYLDDLPKGKENYRERMWDPIVRIRGDIASVWTNYDFWIDGKMSHCGVDSFTLIKIDGIWKITGGAYTVERDCEPSPLGPLEK